MTLGRPVPEISCEHQAVHSPGLATSAAVTTPSWSNLCRIGVARHPALWTLPTYVLFQHITIPEAAEAPIFGYHLDVATYTHIYLKLRRIMTLPPTPPFPFNPQDTSWTFTLAGRPILT